MRAAHDLPASPTNRRPGSGRRSSAPYTQGDTQRWRTVPVPAGSRISALYFTVTRSPFPALVSEASTAERTFESNILPSYRACQAIIRRDDRRIRTVGWCDHSARATRILTLARGVPGPRDCCSEASDSAPAQSVRVSGSNLPPIGLRLSVRVDLLADGSPERRRLRSLILLAAAALWGRFSALTLASTVSYARPGPCPPRSQRVDKRSFTVIVGRQDQEKLRLDHLHGQALCGLSKCAKPAHMMPHIVRVLWSRGLR